MTEKAVILARGLGTRMRREDQAALVTPEQQAAASTGVKALVSVGRPFVDYLLSALVEAGIRHVCLVIGPEHESLRGHCLSLPLERLSIEFAIQEQARGTADAVRAARAFADGDPFLVVNSDNYYPVAALAALAQCGQQALVGFAPSGLLRGNLDDDRVEQFAVLDTDRDGWLRRIVEKPSLEERARCGEDAPVSMNCWRFDSVFFEACDAIEPSPRGEWEMATAVQYAIDHLSLRWRVLRCDDIVWDLTSRRDLAAVTAALQSVEVRW